MANANLSASIGSDGLTNQERQQIRESERRKLRTSNVDFVSSFFVSLMIIVGMFFVLLLVLWLSTRITLTEPPKEILVENQPAGRGDNAPGTERDFDPPGDEEAEDLLEPTIADTIQAVTNVVSSVAASMETADSLQDFTSAGKGGKGDSRPPGPEGEGDDIIPRFMRWQLEFESKDVNDYAKQLDDYKIELGVLGGGVKGVEVVGNLSGSPKKTLIMDTKSEKRLYFMFNRPTPLQKFDMELLGRAGAKTGAGRTSLKFIPADLENELAHIELDYAKSKGHETVKEIGKTVFKSIANGNRFEFTVVSQRYRKPRF
jgi:hypothetical protein